MAGIEAVCIDVPFHTFVQRRSMRMRRIRGGWRSGLRFRERYYIEKWGGLWPNEIFKVPFNGMRHSCRVCNVNSD